MTESGYERNYIQQGETNKIFLSCEGSQVVPARPADKDMMEKARPLNI
jgi:hypothetical protein